MDDVKISSNRNFGLVFFIVFILVAIYPVIKVGEFRLWSLLISSIFLILGLLNSKLLSPLNKIWFKSCLFLGRIIFPLIIGIVFFMVVTPSRILMKVFKKDYKKKLKLD